jgi:hypothetical protein
VVVVDVVLEVVLDVVPPACTRNVVEAVTAPAVAVTA